MFTPGLASLELRECSKLPPQTLVAPLQILREIRVALGKVGFNLQVGVEDAVFVSTDLFNAFNAWDAQNAPPAENQDGGEWN